jgi:hypothetical protein
MGTPHQGRDGVVWAQLLVNVASVFFHVDTTILKHLERDSELLQQQLGQFASISNDFETKFAYEGYPTQSFGGKSIMVHAPLIHLKQSLFNRLRLFQRLQQLFQGQGMQKRYSLQKIILIW